MLSSEACAGPRAVLGRSKPSATCSGLMAQDGLVLFFFPFVRTGQRREGDRHDR